MHTRSFLSFVALVAATSATTLDIDAGQHGLSFEPNTLTAKVGDVVRVHFYPGDHSFTRSTFSNPCTPLTSNGLNSGLINSNSGQDSQMFEFTVNDTQPIWFYCGNVGHCAAGMSGVINPPSGADTLKAYQAASSGKSGSVPNNVIGGALVANVDTDGDAGPKSSSTASATSLTSSPTASPSATAGGNGPYSATGSNAATGMGPGPLGMLLVSIVLGVFLSR